MCNGIIVLIDLVYSFNCCVMELYFQSFLWLNLFSCLLLEERNEIVFG